ncbi:MAG TPA: haloacid dehalogenase-like hydrolase [Polyangiaceae bacterium]
MVEDALLAGRSLNAGELIRELERRRAPGANALAFDGDGTLWSGDVSEDVFSRAVVAGLLRDDARPALAFAAAEFSIATNGSASDIAARLFTAYAQGTYPEREVCEMMTWCYAGWTLGELSQYARDTLAEVGLVSRLNVSLEPILSWARAEGLATYLVSASPRALVEVAAEHWHFPKTHILASDPVVKGDVIEPRMNGDVPYGESKIRVRERLMNGATWLATFGDNVFDLEMLHAARLGVAVRPKPALRKLLPALPFVELVA